MWFIIARKSYKSYQEHIEFSKHIIADAHVKQKFDNKYILFRLKIQ